MRLSLGLEIRQLQVQKMAPRMIQSMEILQLSLLQLEERIEQELIENPVLETQTETPDTAEETEEETESPDAPAETEREMVVDETSDNAADFERLLELDREVPDYFEDGPRVSSNRIQEDANRKHDMMANVESRHETLDFLRNCFQEPLRIRVITRRRTEPRYPVDPEPVEPAVVGGRVEA